MQVTTQRRSSSFAVASPQFFSGEVFSDSWFHGYQGPTRSVRFPHATTHGGGTVAKSDDGVSCVVAGRGCTPDWLFFVQPSSNDSVEQPCASFVCQIRSTLQPLTQSRPSGLADMASNCPRTSGMAVDSRPTAPAPTWRGVAAVSVPSVPRPPESETTDRFQQQDTDERKKQRPHHVGFGQA